MAVTVGGTSITFNDGTVQTTAGGGAPTTAQVLSATSGASVGSVGSYAFLLRNSGSGDTSPGVTRAGSELVYSAGNGSNNFVSLSGTWRCMGFSSGVATTGSATLWLRIS